MLRLRQRLYRPPPIQRSPLTLRLIEILVLGYGALRVLALALKDPVRRDFRAHPALGVGVLGIAALGAWFGVVILQRWPNLLHAAALAVIFASIATWWRARPSYGKSRRWPPGSLGLGMSLDAIGDRTFYQDQAAAHGPVFKMSQFGRPVLCILGLGRGRELLLRNAGSLASASLPYNSFVPKGSLRYMASSDHDSEAPLFRSALAGLDLAHHDRVARVTCRSMLVKLSAESVASEDGVEPRSYLREWVFTVLASVFLGLESADPRLRELDRVQAQLRLDRKGGALWRRQMEEAFVSITELMRTQAAAAAVTGHGSSATALGAVLAADPQLLDNEARTRNLILIFRLAVGDVTGLLDWIVEKLSQHREWQQKVRAAGGPAGSPTPTDGDAVAPRVVMETLRMEQSEYLYRRVQRPLDFEGLHIPAGWLVRICVQESHRDPAIFPNPDTFDPDRFNGRPRSRREYSPFGADDRGCMGVPMVHFLGQIFVEELCRSYSCEASVPLPIEKGTRHRDHWHPNHRRRVRITPVGPQ